MVVERSNRIRSVSGRGQIKEEDWTQLIPFICTKDEKDTIDVRALIRLVSHLFKSVSKRAKFEDKAINAIMRKFRDAGRRSAPWKAASSKVPGRPQDGADGNRILRWKLPTTHKFYASEIDATLVEIKYYLQALSMEGAPPIDSSLRNIFTPWLVEHEVLPGNYIDPVQLIPLQFSDFLNDPRSIQSGHIFPLDRGGKHKSDNTFLMLFRSNQIQGNLTISELLDLMREIINKHDVALEEENIIEQKIRHLS